MKIALTLSALALALTPSLALAGGCGGKPHDKTAASCVPGYSWDQATGACVATPST